jgi:hypothetical protein
MTKTSLPPEVREYMRRIGQRGGKAKGVSKLRGGPEYYRAMSRASWESPKRSRRVPRGTKNNSA